jgi:hypothetical protein
MVRFSIVLPMLESDTRFETSLASILRYRPEWTQVIVPHDPSFQDSYGLAEEVDFVATGRHRHLIHLFNCGLRAAQGQFVALIRPGVEFSNGWQEAIARAFKDDSVGSVSPALVATEMPGRLVTAGVTTNFKRDRNPVGKGRRAATRRAAKLRPLGPSSWAAFYRRSLLSALGSCDEQLDDHYLDLDLALSLRNLGFSCRFERDWIVTIEDPANIQHEFKRPAGRSAQRLLNRQMDISGKSQLLRTLLASVCEMGSSLWRTSNFKHACQRLSAISMRKIDRHHWDLLTVLNAQRQRLIDIDRRSQRPLNDSMDRETRRAA